MFPYDVASTGVVPEALVMGVGTGGTLVGVGQAFRSINPEAKLFAMEPSESSTILCGEVGEHLIEGIADGFVPGIFERHRGLVDTTLAVDSEEAVESMRCLAKQYGLFVGPSSGANLIAAKKIRAAYPELETVITLFCDEGEKYIQEHFAETDKVRVNAEKFA
jgi:cysteine synthase